MTKRETDTGWNEHRSSLTGDTAGQYSYTSGQSQCSLNRVKQQAGQHEAGLKSSGKMGPINQGMLKVPQIKGILAVLLLFGIALAGLSGCGASNQKDGLVRAPEGSATGDKTGSPEKDGSAVIHDPGSRFTTYIDSKAGKIAVLVILPDRARYTDRCPVLVYVPTSFTPDKSHFEFLPGPENAGFIQISLLYPGRSDRETGVSSDGQDDYGGELSLMALRDVLRYACGSIPDVQGRRLDQLCALRPDYDNVGIYAFSHPGIAATVVMAQYGRELSGVDYMVGRENPTQALTSSLEIGYASQGEDVINPAYVYPAAYSASRISVNYGSVRWDQSANAPYFDLNGNGIADIGDYRFSSKVPAIFGKRLYSPELLQALRDNSLAAADWPGDLATPQEAAEWWRLRQTPEYYARLGQSAPSLKVMLVFSQKDHAQAAPDKPHIHQAWDGFRQAGLWVRLNPDKSYVEAVSEDVVKAPQETGPVPSIAAVYAEHPANVQPDDWREAARWGYADQPQAAALIPLAAVEEMADRTHDNRWDADVGNIEKH